MPRKYFRNNNKQRAIWTEQAMIEAIEKVRANKISKREVERQYGIPTRTLNRRMKSGKIEKGRLGPGSKFLYFNVDYKITYLEYFLGCLGEENEKRLVQLINTLSDCGFAPSKSDVRSMAFEFVEKLKIPHKFNRKSRRAGYDWLKSFLERNPELLIRQTEGLSSDKTQGMSKTDVAAFFALLEKILIEHDLLNKPSKIFNVDRLILNNEFDDIVTEGSTDLYDATETDKVENVTVIACCSADGRYVPPVLILKGVQRKPEFSDGLPPGGYVYMNKKSCDISAELFLKWFRTQFIPNKPSGKVLLILDGQSTHSTSMEVLEIAVENDVILLYLPSHCKPQALQPLDRSFFEPLRLHYKQEVADGLKSQSNRIVTQLQVGSLIGKAWQKAATIEIAASGFKECGIYPLDSNLIPDNLFNISHQVPNSEKSSIDTIDFSMFSPSATYLDIQQRINHTLPLPSTSRAIHFEENRLSEEIANDSQHNFSDLIPKYLLDMSPLPEISISLSKRKK